jgi:hypothetical protein
VGCVLIKSMLVTLLQLPGFYLFTIFDPDLKITDVYSRPIRLLYQLRKDSR